MHSKSTPDVSLGDGLSCDARTSPMSWRAVAGSPLMSAMVMSEPFMRRTAVGSWMSYLSRSARTFLSTSVASARTAASFVISSLGFTAIVYVCGGRSESFVIGILSADAAGLARLVASTAHASAAGTRRCKRVRSME